MSEPVPDRLQTLLAKAIEEELWLSDRLSTQVRTIAIGVLAVAWGLLVSPPESLSIGPRPLLLMSALAILTMVVDLLQYVFGYLMVRSHRQKLEHDKRPQGYDPKSSLYRLRVACFWVKLVAALASAVVLGAVIIPPIFRAS